MVLEDEVDDARDRVRTVDGRIAARDDVDPFDQVRRDGVRIDRDAVVEHVRADMAAAVDQHERALRVEAAQIEQVEAGCAEEAGGVRGAEGGAQGGQLVQRVADRDLTGLEELLAADGRDRRGGFEVRAADARSGDDDRAVVACGIIGDGRVALCRRRRDRRRVRVGRGIERGRAGRGGHVLHVLIGGLREGGSCEGERDADCRARAERSVAEKGERFHGNTPVLRPQSTVPDLTRST